MMENNQKTDNLKQLTMSIQELQETFFAIQTNKAKSLKISKNILEPFILIQFPDTPCLIPFIKSELQQGTQDYTVTFENFNHPRFQILHDQDNIFNIQTQEVNEIDTEDELVLDLKQFQQLREIPEIPFLHSVECKRTILLVGRSGVGKSSLANFKMNKKDAFQSGDCPSGVTKTLASASNKLFGKYFELTCIDSPGISDPTVMIHNLFIMIYTALQNKRVNMIVFVMDGASKRIASDDLLLMLFMRQLIKGELPQTNRNLSMIFTKGDKIEPQSEESINDFKRRICQGLERQRFSLREDQIHYFNREEPNYCFGLEGMLRQLIEDTPPLSFHMPSTDSINKILDQVYDHK